MSPLRLSQHAALAVSFAVAACTVGPDYEPPRLELPASFREANAQLVATSPDLSSWWRQFQDPTLDLLIARAGRQNLDIGEALARIAEARALRGAAQAEFAPDIDAVAAYQRRNDSRNTPFGAFSFDFDRFTAGLEASWEIDLFGYVRRSVEAATADLAAQIEAARAVLVAVAAETATNYVQLRALQERVAIARNNLELQQQTLELVETRFGAGLVGERDVAQARSNVATTRARIPALEAELRASENRIAVLLGEAPGALGEELQAQLAAGPRAPAPPLEVAIGVPADVVRRRPDVRSAERELAAATARIGVAEAELYPRLSLTGAVGFESTKVSNLFESPSNTVAAGPTLRWNVFDAGRIRSRIAAEDARTKQALARWERAVLTGIEEAENAMSGFVQEQVRRQHLAEAATESRRAVEFAKAQYAEGLTDFQNVLDSERATAELEDQLAQSAAAISANLIGVYRALGGGWQAEPADSSVSSLDAGPREPVVR